jgi:hypothetical protein
MDMGAPEDTAGNPAGNRPDILAQMMRRRIAGRLLCAGRQLRRTSGLCFQSFVEERPHLGAHRAQKRFRHEPALVDGRLDLLGRQSATTTIECTSGAAMQAKLATC